LAKLGDEHIIPLAFGGNLLLPEASCRACEKITSRIETHCIEQMVRDTREHLGLTARRHRRARSTAVQALVDGRHGDPFSILGPHQCGSMSVVRVLAPGAQKIEVVAREDSSWLGRLELAHPGGLFAGPVVGDRPYRLVIQWPEAVQETEDPYSFGLLLGELDLHLIAQGTHYELARCLGAQTLALGGVQGVRFAVWAPNARRVSVVGDFNTWDGRRHPMRLRREAGVWELFIPRIGAGALYKYELLGPDGALLPQKADPVARASEGAPGTASIVASSAPFAWTDQAWIAKRSERQPRGLLREHSRRKPGMRSLSRFRSPGARPIGPVEISH
jgi:Carbohydrate-binding module 48 (Isoamylase N-terminal domain)